MDHQKNLGNILGNLFVYSHGSFKIFGNPFYFFEIYKKMFLPTPQKKRLEISWKKSKKNKLKFTFTIYLKIF